MLTIWRKLQRLLKKHIVNNFVKRIISGLLFIVLVTGCIFLHPVSFFILFFCINILGLLEFIRIVKPLDIHINIPVCLICGATLFTAGFLDNYIGYEKAYLYFFIAIFALSICELYRKKASAFQNLAFGFYALLYVTTPFTLLNYLPYLHTGEWQPETIFLPFVLVWFNDTFAYLFGSQFGKHKLFPRISPKKSWEGAIGGGISTIIAGVVIAPYINLTYADTAMITCIVVFFGTIGDLIESMFKRCTDIKDSGHIMPGHGGVLDRLDSILFIIPAIYVYLKFII